MRTRVPLVPSPARSVRRLASRSARVWRVPKARRRGGAARLWPALLVTLLALVHVRAPVALAEEAAPGAEGVVLTFFHGRECLHCADERPFLVGLQGRYPSLVVEEFEVYHDEANRERLKQVAAEMGFTASATPVTIIGDQHWVGFDATTAQAIEAAVAAAVAGQPIEVQQRAIVEVPIVGEVDVANSSLLVSALIIGFIDGVNPCSLWVLSVLLAIVLHSGSRGRVLLVGTTFLTVTTAMYALYMTGMYSALDFIGQMSWIRLAIAFIALAFGVVHMKEYFWFKQGPSLTIDDARKPGLYKRMREVAATDKSLPGVIGGTVVMAVGVSLLETPCTAGLPLLWTSMLASRGVSLATALMLFAVYMFVFLLDELAIFAGAVITMRAARLQEQHGRLLKLVSGSVMVTLAVAMFLLPQVMESVSGTVKVFGVSVVLAAVVWTAHRVLVGIRDFVRSRRSAAA